MKTYYPPCSRPKYHGSVFLAGTIDQGASRDWQAELTQTLNSLVDDKHQIAIANPRRTDWNKEWTRDGHPELIKQIRWELRELERADLVFMWIEPNSKSPITLLELGMFAHHVNMIVGCPKDFYRATNIRESVRFLNKEHLCDIIFSETWADFVSDVKRSFKEFYGL